MIFKCTYCSYNDYSIVAEVTELTFNIKELLCPELTSTTGFRYYIVA